MAKLPSTVVVALLLLAAPLALAGGSDECALEFSAPCEQTWEVDNGQIVGPDGLDLEIASAWAADLAAAVSERVHKDPECKIANWTVLKACRMAEDAVHMFFQHNIECPDGNSFKVKYETKGTIISDESDKLEEPNTRFVCVFDSTFA